MRSGQIDTVCYQLLACTAAGSGAGLLIGKEKGVLKEGRRKVKGRRKDKVLRKSEKEII